ncbi:MAG: serine/threonine-protein phosphatase [Candidatus Riflebacteria bacterium]|nr:serine/threonine-protein phosphatase [Candidatus Riflebacteria bacterium]
MKRANNEDSFLSIPPWQEPSLSKKLCLFAVADGVGGHVSGEIASSLAVQSLQRDLSTWKEHELTKSTMETLVGDANQYLREHVKKNPQCEGMGTTLTTIAISSSKAIIGHIGDTRAYLLRNGKLEQITRDHTLVGEQIRLGKLTPDQAKVHPGRHILSRVMGPREFVSIDSFELNLMPGDLIVLLSDGITGLVSDEEIKNVLISNAFNKTASVLVQQANKAGGADNSTAVVIKINEVPLIFPPKFSLERVKALLYGFWRG